MERFKSFITEQVPQAIRMAVAGVASLYLARLFKLPQGYWAAMSAFVVIGSDVRTTGKASRDRLIGTGIGAVLGGVFSHFWGGNLLWFGVASGLTVLLCEVLGLGQSYRLACVTVAILMLVRSTVPPASAAVYRFLEVALGIVVALVVSAVPPRPPASNS